MNDNENKVINFKLKLPKKAINLAGRISIILLFIIMFKLYDSTPSFYPNYTLALILPILLLCCAYTYSILFHKHFPSYKIYAILLLIGLFLSTYSFYMLFRDAAYGASLFEFYLLIPFIFSILFVIISIIFKKIKRSLKK